MAAAGAALPGAHVVHAYRDDAEIVAAVARYVADGLAAGERALVVATADHRAGVDEVLLQYGADPEQARASGGYVTLDAGELLDRFLVDALPDPALFSAVVGALVADLTADGHALRVFGEMVMLLWDAGNVPGALQLEALWNELLRRGTFSLLCGYPLTSLGDGDLVDVTSVCRLHSQLEASKHYATVSVAGGGGDAGRRQSEVLLPVPAAVPSARRFVLAVLQDWRLGSLADEAALLATELATNAVEHAGTAFRLSLTRAGTGLRIALEDVNSAAPQVLEPVPDAFGGRGVAIIERLADAWGWDRVGAGKVVWAELASAPA